MARKGVEGLLAQFKLHVIQVSYCQITHHVPRLVLLIEVVQPFHDLLAPVKVQGFDRLDYTLEIILEFLFVLILNCKKLFIEI